MKQVIKTSQRRCSKFKGNCENCKIDCPFPFCQHMDCMSCLQRVECPMCDGDCKTCTDRTICAICEKN